MKTASSPKLDSAVRPVCLGLALVTLLAYLPIFFHQFITFDDPAYVSSNPTVQKGLTWAGVKWAFSGWHASNWHPLTWISHMLDCQLFGTSPGPQHLMNALLHVANTVLLFFLWERMTKTVWSSALIAALFALHPLHVESVAWIAERKDVLSAFFGLLAMWWYVRYAETGGRRPEMGEGSGQEEKSEIRSSKSEGKSEVRNPKEKFFYYVLAVVFFGLGLMAKPMLVTLPFVLLLLDGWPLGRFKKETRWKVVLEKLPFFALAAISCVITVFAQRQEAVATLQQFPLSFRISNALVSYSTYLIKTVLPVDLGIFYPAPLHYPLWQIIGSAALLFGISVWVWLLRKRKPYLLTGWCWFVGMLVPVIGLVQVGNQAMADRYTYLPLIGIFAAVAFGVGDAVIRAREGRVIVGLALAACLILTERQLHFWRDSEALFIHELAITEQNGLAHMMLGTIAEREGDSSKALEQYKEALRLDPTLLIQTENLKKRALALHYQLLLGQAADQQGNLKDAVAHYTEALRLEPNALEAHNNLGRLLNRAGEPKQALVHFREAARLAPESMIARCNVGTTLVELGRFDQAMQEFSEAARLQPNDPRPLYLIGKAHLRQGQTEEAILHFRAALKLDPKDAQTMAWLARVLASSEEAKFRNGKQALALAKEANELTEGKQPFVLDALAMALAENGAFAGAQRVAAKAIELAQGTKQTNLLAELRQHRDFYLASKPVRQVETKIDK